MNQNLFSVLTEEERQLPFYICSAGGWTNQENMLREEGYADFQWLQCLDGEGCLIADGSKHAVAKGQGMLLFPNVKHHYFPVREPWEVMWVTFNGSYAAELLASLHFTMTQVLYVSNPDLLLKKMHDACTWLRSKDPMRGFECSRLIYEIVLNLYTYASASEVRSKQQHYEQLSPVLGHIEDRYNLPLTLDELAGILRLSTQYTCRLFQQTLGMRPFEYITKVRLRKAKELLLQDVNTDIRRVAEQVGYEHPSYFIKLFKQQEGVTPSMFRRIHRV